MKLKKRIAAMGAAMVMAVSMMSIGASAYSVSFSVSKSNPSFSNNVTVTNRKQVINLTRFDSTTGSVTLKNNISSALNVTWTAPNSISYTVSDSALGTTTLISVKLNNPSSGAVASGNFTG